MAKDVVVKRKRSATQVADVLARRALLPVQRLLIHALVQSTTKKEAIDLLNSHGYDVTGAHYRKWIRDPDFVAALHAAETLVAEMITKESVLRKSEAALEKAMEGVPVLGYVEKDRQEIVGYKPDLSSAARLIEMQGKAVGMFQENIDRLAVLVDVDFSGRKDAPPIAKVDVIDVEPTARIEAVEHQTDDVVADYSWLD